MSPIPIPERGRTTTPEVLQTMRNNGLLPSGVRYWASPKQYWDQHRSFAPGAGGPGKIYQDSTYHYNQTGILYYGMIDRANPRLKLVKMPAGGSIETTRPYPGGESFSHSPTFAAFSQQVAQHLNDNIAAFPEIPRLTIAAITTEEAYRLELQKRVNMADENSPTLIESDVPLFGLFEDPAQWSIELNGKRYRTTWPKSWFLAFQPDGSIAAVPVGWLPTGYNPGTGGTTPTLSSQALVMAVEDVIVSPLPVDDKAAAIRTLAKK